MIKSMSLMRNDAPTICFAIFILFFLQQATFLVESIYMLNLLHTSMDARALAVLFFYSPILLLFFRKSVGKRLLFIIGLTFTLTSLVTAWCSTEVRIVAAGIAVGSFLLFIGLFFSRTDAKRVNWMLSLSVAILLSVIFRAFGSTLDISMIGSTRILGILLGITGILTLYVSLADHVGSEVESKYSDRTPGLQRLIASIGFASGIALLYFMFSSPTVLTRWTETSYSLVYIFYMIPISFFVIFLLWRRQWISRLKTPILLLWNIIFSAATILTIMRQAIQFPVFTDAAPVIVGATSTTMTVPLFLTLFLAPVIFINMQICIESIFVDKPYRLALPLTGAGIFISILIFMLIFTNVWGYVGDFSLFFRNKFYLPFLLAGFGLLPSLLILERVRARYSPIIWKKAWTGFVVVASIATLSFVVIAEITVSPLAVRPSHLTLMSYNIQQGVDYVGNKNYQKQLELIQRVNPDVICLQESDVARISGGNSDVVRYFAQKLRFYSYYGPNTVTGTFGTAILSRYKLENCRTFFSYSDGDEIGTSLAELYWDDKVIGIFNSHPAGSKDAKHAHVDALLNQIANYDYVIAAGDYNFRPGSPYYEKVVANLNDSWLARWPDGVGDMSTADIKQSAYEHPFIKSTWIDDTCLRMDDRIDHIFVSNNIKVLNSVYLPVPASQTDHPAHWVIVQLVDEGLESKY